jgi:hypothetical protein
VRLAAQRLKVDGKILKLSSMTIGCDQTEGNLRMGKSLLATLSIIALCTIALCSLCFVRTVSATKAGFSQTDGTGTLVTVDGIISPSEWDDSWKGNLYDGWTLMNSTYRVKWAQADTNLWYDQWLFEILGDNTNDTGDFIQICYDSTLDGGAAPQTDDYLVNYTGHSTVNVYQGTGTGWAPTSIGVIVAGKISASSASATPHWIIEIDVENPWESTGDRMVAYDASTNTTLMWPPYSNANVPDDYGYSEISYGTIPEGLTIGVMVLLSTVAVIVSLRYFRKTRIKRYSQLNL